MDSLEKHESIGVMSGAYFVGRNQLLAWINELTQLNYTKIEQTASGVFACHVFDALYPGQIKIEKVRFGARHEHEFVINYKVLQACFDRLGMKRQIDVQKLIKGKYQDNLEFVQWLKAYFDAHATEHAKQYNGAARRQEVKARSGSSNTTSPRTSGTIRTRNLGSPASSTSSRANARGGGGALPSSKLYNGAKASKTMLNVSNTSQLKKLKEEIGQLKREKEELQAAAEDAITEREFYFNKLRKVELICQGTSERMEQGDESIELLRNSLEEIKAALYAEEDVPVEEDGQLPEEAQFEDAEGGYQGELQQDPQYVQEVPAEALRQPTE